MIKYFEPEKHVRYLTSDIQCNLPMELIMFLWSCIDQAGSSMSIDYLQVFKLRTERNEISGKLMQYIIHSQEEPKYSKEHVLEEVNGGINDVIFVIDDIKYQTMMFSRNY